MNRYADSAIRLASVRMCPPDRCVFTPRQVRIVRSASGVMMLTQVPVVSPTSGALAKSMLSSWNSVE